MHVTQQTPHIITASLMQPTTCNAIDDIEQVTLFGKKHRTYTLAYI